MTLCTRSRLLSVALIGIVLLPMVQHFNDPVGRRGGRRHAARSCYLKHRGSESARRARAIRRRERQARRVQELRRVQEALLGAKGAGPEAFARMTVRPAGDSAATPAQTAQSVSDPTAGDDSDFLKRGKRRARATTRWWLLDERPRAQTEGELVALVRVKLEDRSAQLRREAEPLPHFGSGPCHSIPRPREGTLCPGLLCGRAAV